MRKQIIAGSLMTLVALGACKKTGEGEYEVDKPVVGTVKDTVQTPTVDVGTKKDTITTPTVDVDVGKKKTEVTVPTVDVKKPGEKKP